MITRSVSTLRQPAPAHTTEQRRAVLATLAEKVLACGAGRLRVVLDGRTASGKTTLADELAETLHAAGRPVLRAGLDDFKRPWSERHEYDRESGAGYYRNAYDYDAVWRLLLDPMAAGGSGEVALCAIDPRTQVRHDHVVVAAPPDAVLLVDGIFALRPELAGAWDLAVWVDVPAATSLRRGIERDREWAGAEATRLHEQRYAVSEELYLREADPVPHADLVIDNSDFAAPTIG